MRLSSASNRLTTSPLVARFDASLSQHDSIIRQTSFESSWCLGRASLDSLIIE
jgi:hypothetical protein